ncbi:uncharacterized protein DSM5745_10777 [Aspergillus mulundensis]|uniref:Uncharacterized protein n=1 Tax=Aspergillus mulundensis TaxID=1810919 RepID=A0A3D8QHN0_9EURO|nr:hypothetical protein DSM5745_10777 [Aspergillus mulundensis]RDW61279.1 hypothetical protein DSM5745_10777 [Aspergillus mulundensis]
MSSPRIDSSSRKQITKVQIKPLLKRVSQDGSLSTSIDLSRSSFEQEGLGIYTNYERDSVQSDLYTNFPTRRKLSDLNRRSTSGTSQLSTASSSSMGRPAYTYRRTPRAYTPPLLTHGQNYFDVQAAEADGQPRLSLHLPDTTFTPGGSQTNVTGRASFGYSRDSAVETTSRSSLDFVFRSRTRTSMDPVSRAATIQAARQAFEEKEAAKNRKFEEQRMKAEEKQIKRETPKEEPPKSETQPPPNSENWKSQSKSTWMLFLTWLRTRIFKFRRRVRSLS